MSVTPSCNSWHCKQQGASDHCPGRKHFGDPNFVGAQTAIQLSWIGNGDPAHAAAPLLSLGPVGDIGQHRLPSSSVGTEP